MLQQLFNSWREAFLDVVKQYQKLTKLLDRVSRAIRMSAETEMAEIIRRRLFQWDVLPNEAKKVIRAYADWAVDHSTALVGVKSDTAYQLFESSYPFHPSVLSVFERKWSSLPQFQRTRGILRLLALWVAKVYQDDHLKSRDEPLITLGSAPLEDQTFRDAVFKQFGCDELDIPAMTDIARATADATRLDNAGTASQQKLRLHQKVATTIFFESNGSSANCVSVPKSPRVSGRRSWFDTGLRASNDPRKRSVTLSSHRPNCRVCWMVTRSNARSPMVSPMASSSTRPRTHRAV